MWLILCGATVCCDYLRFSYFNLLILWDLLIFLGVFLSLYFLLILLDYVFVMDFLYMYTVPRGGTGVVSLLWFYLNTRIHRKQMLAQ
jgi:hypothetical protein